MRKKTSLQKIVGGSLGRINLAKINMSSLGGSRRNPHSDDPGLWGIPSEGHWGGPVRKPFVDLAQCDSRTTLGGKQRTRSMTHRANSTEQTIVIHAPSVRGQCVGMRCLSAIRGQESGPSAGGGEPREKALDGSVGGVEKDEGERCMIIPERQAPLVRLFRAVGKILVHLFQKKSYDLMVRMHGVCVGVLPRGLSLGSIFFHSPGAVVITVSKL